MLGMAIYVYCLRWANATRCHRGHSYSLLAAWSCFIRRDLRRAAFPRWIAPFWAALSSATTVSFTAISAASKSLAVISRRDLFISVLARERSGAFLARFLSWTR